MLFKDPLRAILCTEFNRLSFAILSYLSWQPVMGPSVHLQRNSSFLRKLHKSSANKWTETWWGCTTTHSLCNIFLYDTGRTTHRGPLCLSWPPSRPLWTVSSGTAPCRSELLSSPRWLSIILSRRQLRKIVNFKVHMFKPICITLFLLGYKERSLIL